MSFCSRSRLHIKLGCGCPDMSLYMLPKTWKTAYYTHHDGNVCCLSTTWKNLLSTMISSTKLWCLIFQTCMNLNLIPSLWKLHIMIIRDWGQASSSLCLILCNVGAKLLRDQGDQYCTLRGKGRSLGLWIWFHI